MSEITNQYKLPAVSLVVTIMIAVVNIGSVAVAYRLFKLTNPTVAQIAITDTNNEYLDIDNVSQNFQSTLQVQENNTSVTNTNKSQVIVVRQVEESVKIGGTPKPAVIIKNQDGSQSIKWCVGINNNLPDLVCKSILSIAANPTSTNPYIGKGVLKWLTLLPPNGTITIDESSWNNTSVTKGEIKITLDTTQYGKMNLIMTLELSSDIWIVTDGRAG